MAFNLPAFNLKCNIWRAQATIPNPAVTPPTLANVPCQLRLTGTGLLVMAFQTSQAAELLLLPAGTDIRRPNTGGSVGDIVEVPAGTGRFYVVMWVADRAKGFSNEHRVAGIHQETTVPGGWPYPTP